MPKGKEFLRTIRVLVPLSLSILKLVLSSITLYLGITLRLKVKKRRMIKKFRKKLLEHKLPPSLVEELTSIYSKELDEIVENMKNMYWFGKRKTP